MIAGLLALSKGIAITIIAITIILLVVAFVMSILYSIKHDNWNKFCEYLGILFGTILTTLFWIGSVVLVVEVLL